MTRILSVVLGTLLVLPGAWADEAKIRSVVGAALGGVRIEGVQPAPLPGLYEVRFQSREGPQIVYTDAEAKFIVQGSLYDVQGKRDLTEERLSKLSAIKFDALPFDLAVKVQRGNGRRVLAMFSDPYCPYCQQFEKTLQTIDDVTIYVFMFPVIRPQNADHSKAVWCSADRAKAWLELAIHHKRPAASPACDNPVDKVLELGRSLRVNSTPTLFFADGARARGGMRADDLRAKLDQAARAANAR